MLSYVFYVQNNQNIFFKRLDKLRFWINCTHLVWTIKIAVLIHILANLTSLLCWLVD